MSITVWSPRLEAVCSAAKGRQNRNLLNPWDRQTITS